MIRAIKFVSIPVSDQDRALEFYTAKLGFAIHTDQPMGEGQRWIELGIPGAETRVVLFTAEAHRDRIGTPSDIVFMSENVEKTYKELVGRGVEFLHEPKKEPWGTYTVLKDPDGNQFVLGTKS